MLLRRWPPRRRSLGGVLLLGMAGLFALGVYEPDYLKKLPVLGALPWPKLIGNTAARARPRHVSQHLRDIVVASQYRPRVIFLGDSLVNRWRTDGRAAWTRTFEPMGGAYLGVGEDRVQHLLARLRSEELDGLDPDAFVIEIGTNNVGRNSPEEIADAIDLCVLELLRRFPRANILLMGIFPRGRSDGEAPRAKLRETNRLLSLIEGRRVRFLDIGDRFLAADGWPDPRLVPDGVHLSSRAYEIWAEAIGPLIRDWLDRAPPADRLAGGQSAPSPSRRRGG